MIYMFLSNNPLSGDINSSNLPCWQMNSLFEAYCTCDFQNLEHSLPAIKA